MDKIRNIGILILFAITFVCCRHDEGGGHSINPTLKIEVENVSIDGTSHEPKTLLNGKKEIIVRSNQPILNIALKEKYEGLAGTVKIGANSQNLNFNNSASASYNFSALTEDEKTNLEVCITAKNREDIKLKFILIYKPVVEPKPKMEITGFTIESKAFNPETLLDGKKEIIVRTNQPTLNITLKENYKELAGTIKVGTNSQSLNFNNSASASYNFSTLTEDVKTNVEVAITAKDREEIKLKFIVTYKPYEKVNITKITVAGEDFAPPFDSLNAKIFEIKKNSAKIAVETATDTKELSGKVNDTISLVRDPVRSYIAYADINNLSEGDNPISLKMKAKEKNEVSFNFTIKYTRPIEPPVDIASITIDDKIFAKGSTLESLNNSTVDITKETFDLKVELTEDYAGKKVRVSNGADAVSTKDSNWQGKIATLSCNSEYKDITIKITADDKLAVTYKVKVVRIKDFIDVFQIVIDDDNKYGKFGKDLATLLDSSPTTETILLKKEKVNVKVILASGESVEEAEIVSENTNHIPLNFGGTVATAEVTLNAGINNFTLHLGKTVSTTKINADYKFILDYKKECPKFKYIKLKLNDTNKHTDEYDLKNFIASFVVDGDVLACKKEYSLWNNKAEFICGIKNAQNKFEYAVSKEKTLPTVWNVFSKNFKVDIDEATTYVFMKISVGAESSVYRCELAPIVNAEETGVSKSELEYLDASGNTLYQGSGLTKKVKILVKPTSPKVQGIHLKEPEDIAFTKVIANGKYINWYEVELPITEAIMEVKTINAKYEVKAENGIDKEDHTQEIKLIPTLIDFELAYAEDFTSPVKAVFDKASNTYNIVIDNSLVANKKLYLRLYVADYYVVSSDGITFEDGERKTIGQQEYVLKSFVISDFENTKSFKIGVKEDSDKGLVEYNVEIK